MDSGFTTLVQVVTWWAIGLLAGVADWTNHRIMAGMLVLICMSGFTVTAIHDHQHDEPMFAASRTGNSYHNVGAVCLKNVADPIHFRTEHEAQTRGFGPCDRCVLHQYEVAHNIGDGAATNRGQ